MYACSYILYKTPLPMFVGAESWYLLSSWLNNSYCGYTQSVRHVASAIDVVFGKGKKNQLKVVR